MDTFPATTDVVIVGAGPLGMALATALIADGIDVLPVDKLAEGAKTSRGLCHKR
jgi:2-polyprenyl-6-methoxyphenol hydroxylase-like FAD-dependent oxidoreductase